MRVLEVLQKCPPTARYKWKKCASELNYLNRGKSSSTLLVRINDWCNRHKAGGRDHPPREDPNSGVGAYDPPHFIILLAAAFDFSEGLARDGNRTLRRELHKLKRPQRSFPSSSGR
jgi:hypothetical protein